MIRLWLVALLVLGGCAAPLEKPDFPNKCQLNNQVVKQVDGYNGHANLIFPCRVEPL